jgi:hypothetical protein
VSIAAGSAVLRAAGGCSARASLASLPATLVCAADMLGNMLAVNTAAIRTAFKWVAFARLLNGSNRFIMVHPGNVCRLHSQRGCETWFDFIVVVS